MNNVFIFFHMRASIATHTYEIIEKLGSPPLLPLSSLDTMVPLWWLATIGNTMPIVVWPLWPLPDGDAKDVLSLLKKQYLPLRMEF